MCRKKPVMVRNKKEIRREESKEKQDCGGKKKGFRVTLVGRKV